MQQIQATDQLQPSSLVRPSFNIVEQTRFTNRTAPVQESYKEPSINLPTVDGWNPKQPPGLYKTL